MMARQSQLHAAALLETEVAVGILHRLERDAADFEAGLEARPLGDERLVAGDTHAVAIQLRLHVVHLDEREAAVLLVTGAQPAIERAAVTGPALDKPA
jgi:hypothetical protein